MILIGILRFIACFASIAIPFALVMGWSELSASQGWRTLLQAPAERGTSEPGFLHVAGMIVTFIGGIGLTAFAINAILYMKQSWFYHYFVSEEYSKCGYCGHSF